MTDRELKKCLKNVYEVPETKRKREFIRCHEKRTRQLADVLMLELKYLGLRSIVSGIGLAFLIYLIATTRDKQFMWLMSGMLPIGALLPMSLINKSERYGMSEFEMVSRFSMQMLRTVRLMILGIFSLVVLLLSSGMFGAVLSIRFGDSLLYVAIPYLVNVGGSFYITRKLHSKENIYGCIAMTFISCLLPYLYEHTKLLQSISNAGYWVILAVSIFISMKEAYIYIKESENESWNLC